MIFMHIVKVNPAAPQSYNSSGPSDYTGDSDNSKSFRHHSDMTNGRDIDLLGWNSDSES